MTSPEGSRLGVLIRQLQGNVAELVDTVAALPVMTWGESTVTFDSGVAGGVNVAHGLGVAPALAFATACVTGDGRNDYVMNAGNRDDTVIAFTVRAAAGEDFPVTIGTPVDFAWVVFA